MKRILLVILLLSASVVTADEIILNIGSRHINSAVEYNENNYGLGYRWEAENIELGYFRNSYYHLNASDAKGIGYSVYIKGSAWDTVINRYFKIGIDVGLAIYGKDGVSPILPIIQPMVMVRPFNRLSFNIGYMPLFIETKTIDDSGETVTSDMLGMLTLSASYHF